jgi:hypothetical protein
VKTERPDVPEGTEKMLREAEAQFVGHRCPKHGKPIPEGYLEFDLTEVCMCGEPLDRLI